MKLPSLDAIEAAVKAHAVRRGEVGASTVDLFGAWCGLLVARVRGMEAEYARGVADERKQILAKLAALRARCQVQMDEWWGEKSAEPEPGHMANGMEWAASELDELIEELRVDVETARAPSARWEHGTMMLANYEITANRYDTKSTWWIRPQYNTREGDDTIAEGEAKTFDDAKLAAEDALRALLRAAMEELG